MSERINILIGGTGTIGAWALGHWEHVAGIAAGMATAAYMVTSLVFLMRDKIKGNSNES